MWAQREISVQALPRGYHLITREVLDAVPEQTELSVGLLHLFLRHTSASLTLNENARPDVRHDFASYFDRRCPDALLDAHAGGGRRHAGPHQDLAAGPSLSIRSPAGASRLGPGGDHLCEHRDHGGPRSLLATLSGATEG